MSTDTPPQGLVLGSKLYDQLKFVALFFLPGLASLVLAVGQIWELDGAEKVALTVTAVDLFLGGLLKISSSNFDKVIKAEQEPDGAFVVTALPDGRKSVKLEFEQDPATLVDGRVLSFAVKSDDLAAQVPEEESRDENTP